MGEQAYIGLGQAMPNLESTRNTNA